MNDNLPMVKLGADDLAGYTPFANQFGPKRPLYPCIGIGAFRPTAVVGGRAKGEGGKPGNAKLTFTLEPLDPDLVGLGALVKDQAYEGRQKNTNRPNAFDLADALVSCGLSQEQALGVLAEGVTPEAIAGVFVRTDAIVYVSFSDNSWTPADGKNAGTSYCNSAVKNWKSKDAYESAKAARDPEFRAPLPPQARAWYEANIGAIPPAFSHLYPNAAQAPAVSAAQAPPASNGQGQRAPQTQGIAAALAALAGR